MYRPARCSSNWATVEDTLQKYLDQGVPYAQAKIQSAAELETGQVLGPFFNVVSSATTSCLRASGLRPSDSVSCKCVPSQKQSFRKMLLRR